MFDFEVLQLLWWAIIGIILVVYASTAGYDIGVTMVMPFFSSEMDRRVILNTSAPTWDGNQTWIVFAGGALFVVWPAVYSTAFSGMYVAMFCILWSLFLRPPGYDYRSKINNATWRRSWDWALFISSVVPVFVFGVAFGNCLLGFPFYFDPLTMREFYTGGLGGLLSGFGVLCGVTSIMMILMHGMAYLQRRTEGHIRERARRLHVIVSIIVLMLFSIAGYIVVYKINGYQLLSSASNPIQDPLSNTVMQTKGAWIGSYAVYPWKYFAPVIVYLAVVSSIWCNYSGWVNACFWSSVFAVGGVIATAGGTLFPFIMPSSTHPNQSLTVWNATSNEYALSIMLYVGIFLLLLIMCYKIFAFHTVWGAKSTLTAEDIAEDEHAFY